MEIRITQKGNSYKIKITLKGQLILETESTVYPGKMEISDPFIQGFGPSTVIIDRQD